MSTRPLPSACRQRTIAYRGIPLNEPHSNVIHLDDHRNAYAVQAAPDQEHVCFPLTIDADLSTQAQDILQHACGDAIDAITYEPLPRKHQTKLRVHLKATAYGIALHALIIGLPAAEFGSVIHITPHL